MKLLTLIFGLLAVLGLSACSMGGNDTQSLGDKFQEGIQGQGKIVPNNPTQDSFGPNYQ